MAGHSLRPKTVKFQVDNESPASVKQHSAGQQGPRRHWAFRRDTCRQLIAPTTRRVSLKKLISYPARCTADLDGQYLSVDPPLPRYATGKTLTGRRASPIPKRQNRPISLPAGRTSGYSLRRTKSIPSSTLRKPLRRLTGSIDPDLMPWDMFYTNWIGR